MKCKFKKNIFHDKDSGYSVSVFLTDDGSVPPAARSTYYKGKGIHFTATGHNLPSDGAVQAELSGSWVKGRYGLQLAVESCEELLPETVDGIRTYLASGMIKGVGPKTAEAIAGRFGLKTFTVLDNEPERLLEIRGVTEKKLEAILGSYRKSRAMRNLAAYLSPYQISPGKIGKIYETFGSRALDTVKDNTYLLCRISGFGFLTVDRIARANRRSPNAPLRIEGCIGYCMEKAMQEGHLYKEQELFLQSIYEQLNAGYNGEVVTLREISTVVYHLVKEGKLFLDQGNLYTSDNYCYETQTAQKLAAMMAVRKPTGRRLDALIAKAQENLGITLSARQAEGVKMVFSHPVSIITGGPGTGKTTVQKVLLCVNERLGRDKVLSVAPTGRASRRMAESTGSKAFTMHSACRISGEEQQAKVEMLDAGFIIADEQSMVDMRLMWEFVRRIETGTRLVLIGDACQLPSVGPGNVFRELAGSGVVPVTVLDRVFRQGKNSRIAHNASLMQENSVAFEYGSDFIFLPAESDAEAAALTEEIYLKETEEHGLGNVQILTPFRKRGEASAASLNEQISRKTRRQKSGAAKVQEIGAVKARESRVAKIQETGSTKMSVTGKEFHVGDKVIQNRNRDQVSNGDIGFVRDIFTDEDGNETARLEFSDGRAVEYQAAEMETVELAYAVTVHKSQGSEFPVVIMPWLPMFYMMLKRNILYTAITRAREKVYLIGSKGAIARAVHACQDESRNTRLGERLAKCYRSLLEKTGREKRETA